MARLWLEGWCGGRPIEETVWAEEGPTCLIGSSRSWLEGSGPSTHRGENRDTSVALVWCRLFLSPLRPGLLALASGLCLCRVALLLLLLLLQFKR